MALCVHAIGFCRMILLVFLWSVCFFSWNEFLTMSPRRSLQQVAACQQDFWFAFKIKAMPVSLLDRSCLQSKTPALEPEAFRVWLPDNPWTSGIFSPPTPLITLSMWSWHMQHCCCCSVAFLLLDSSKRLCQLPRYMSCAAGFDVW